MLKINKIERGDKVDHVHVEHMPEDELHKGRLPAHIESALQEEFSKPHNPARRRVPDDVLAEDLKDVNKMLESK